MNGTLIAIDLGEKYKLNSSSSVADVFATPADFLNKVVLPNMYVFAGIIIFGLLIGGGLTILMSGGDPKGTEKGMQTIQTAVIGFLVILSAYWIIQVVQIVIGQPILNGGP
ncbi:MAG: hypothetical protein HZA34_03070 [Candidatus Pacebacteria bacterium]|nr:hypothetical protein [Candidatus Paceibacterota bacterium]